MDEKIIIIRDPKTFCFNFDWPKDVDENLKHEIEFIEKWNFSWEKKIKKREWTIIVEIQVWKQYSWTKKTGKRMSHINLFLTCPKD